MGKTCGHWPLMVWEAVRYDKSRAPDHATCFRDGTVTAVRGCSTLSPRNAAFGHNMSSIAILTGASSGIGAAAQPICGERRHCHQYLAENLPRGRRGVTPHRFRR